MAFRWILCLTFLLLSAGTAAAEPRHAIAMHGSPKYGPGFLHLDYADLAAPKGGSITLSKIGTFDSLNPFIIRGVPAEGRTLTFESLMGRSRDEPFSLYGLIAESIEVPDDRSWVIFRLNPKARFHDGKPVTADDVIFSLETRKSVV